MENIKACDFYLLRTPLLSIEKLIAFHENYSADTLHEQLAELFRSPLVKEAIYIASPDLMRELESFEHITDQKKKQKIVKSLYKYFVRMCARATPYGLFAGCSLGEFGNTTEIMVSSKDIKKMRRLDMNYVAELLAAINTQEEIFNKLKYFPNNSIYLSGDKLRYTEALVHDKQRSYRLQSVDNSDYIQTVLKLSEAGATAAELKSSLRAYDDSLSQEEVDDFVLSLIENQLLVSELQPAVTGPDFLPTLIQKLQQFNETPEIVEPLTKINAVLKDQSSSIDNYKNVCRLMKGIVEDTTEKDLVQVDLFFNATTNTIDKNWVDTINEQIKSLFKLSTKYVIADVEEFKKQFLERYDQKEVPLMEALDPELGIGYAEYVPGKTDINPLSDNLASRLRDGTEIKWGQFSSYRLSKFANALANHQTEIILEDEEIEQLSKGKKIFIPDQFYSMGSIIKGQRNEIPDLILNNLMGPSGFDIMARFAHGIPSLDERIRKVYDWEQKKYPDIIFAEVVHLPPQRIGNILLRPAFRQFEIPFLGQSSLEMQNQIPVDDLFVSVVNDEVVLRSKKFNKRVIPKLTSAHNYSVGNLSVYKFLCDVQYQNLNMGFSWEWDVLATQPYLPRVRYKNIIVAKAQWLLKLSEIKKYCRDEVNVPSFRNYLSTLNLPRFVTVIEADNLLPVDTTNELAIETLLDFIQKKKAIVISEFLQTPDNCLVHGNEGAMVNELVIPFMNDDNVHQQAWFPEMKETAVKRDFFVGQEWLYYKIFCGTQSGERILREEINALVDELKAASHIDKWFFIRYFDPEPHLRLRFHHKTNDEFWPAVVKEIGKRLDGYMSGGLINRVETGTYTRELERYSAACMQDSESLFHYDSEAVLKILSIVEDTSNPEQSRWLLAMRGIDAWLSDFNLDAEQKLEFLKPVQESFFREFGGSTSLRHHLNDQYRRDYPYINEFINKAKSGKFSYLSEHADLIFTSRSEQSAAVISKIKSTFKGKEQFIFSNLLPGYIHMFCNRVFLSNHRKNELVLYHYLCKFYESLIARSRKTKTKNTNEIKPYHSSLIGI